MYENIAGSPVQEIVVSEPLEAGGRHPRHTANLSRFKFLLFSNHWRVLCRLGLSAFLDTQWANIEYVYCFGGRIKMAVSEGVLRPLSMFEYLSTHQLLLLPKHGGHQPLSHSHTRRIWNNLEIGTDQNLLKQGQYLSYLVVGVIFWLLVVHWTTRKVNGQLARMSMSLAWGDQFRLDLLI